MDETNNTTVEAQDTFKIPEENFSKFEAKIAKLNRRAIKLGVPVIDYTTVDVVEDWVRNTKTGTTNPVNPEREYGEDYVLFPRLFKATTVIGLTPKLAGWSFIGTLDHVSEAGVILRAVPGEELPKAYREAQPVCDHCQAARRRKETFIVRNDEGTYKQVGRQCVADFLGGVDPKNVARALEYIYEALRTAGECEDELGGYGYADNRRYLKRVLAVTTAVIREYGWLSRSKARELDYAGAPAATADIVSGLLYKNKLDDEDRKLLRSVTEEDEAFAEQTIAWLTELRETSDDLNDYLYNLTTLAQSATISSKSFGLACSMVSTYQRHLGDLIRREKWAEVNAKSRYFGTVGKREVFTVTVLNVIFRESQFGVTKIHKLVTKDGNLATWFASAEALEQGKTYEVKATVKKHEEFQGVQQTVVTRVAVVKEVEA